LGRCPPGARGVQGKRDEELALIDASTLVITVSEVERDVIHHYRPKVRTP
jgi:hypothetical protein